MPTLSSVVLVLATAATGLTAGVFFLYSNAVMPGLRATDDRTFVTAFQSIDRAIINPVWLGGGFFGVLLLTAAACVLHVELSLRPVLPWIIAALVMHAAVVVITMAVHVPLNDAIKAAGDPATIDVDQVRTAFSEARWLAWNGIRIVLDVAAFLTMCVALIIHGQVSE